MNSPLILDGAVGLSHWGVIRAQGDDAATFLHGQLSNDFTLLGLAQARLAAYCSPKGRMLASFVALKRSPAELWLACDAQVLPAALKRLSMFVLRAKARLTDASSEITAIGLTGPRAEAWLGDAARLAVWGKSDVAEASIVRLPDAALPDGRLQRRFVWFGPRPAAQTVSAELPALPLEQWQWLEVMSGVATVSAATVEQFVPQMLNYELVGGVDFKKGCYPGQEIVARSQYRGTIKRRAAIVHAPVALSAGVEVFASNDPGQPAGLVAQAAPSPLGGHSAIVELKLAALEAGSLHLGAPDGPALSVGRLPYSVPVDSAAPA